MEFNELTDEQRRQFVDLVQVFEQHEQAALKQKHSYAGSMRWLLRNGTEYLHRKKGKVEKSLGPRSLETEEIYDKFLHGRRTTEQRIKTLSEKLDQMAPVNRALNLGRVPFLTAKILRKLGEEELLGNLLQLVGTNALWAYEAKSGIHLSSGILATTDADLLMDARKKLSFLSDDVRKKGIVGILQKIDSTFEQRSERDFKAINSMGFSVDLIQPEDFSTQLSGKARKTITGETNDLHGAPIFGLHWLLNAPAFSAVAVGSDGYPLRISTVDPRAFVLHKLWISESSQRDPLKKQRDKHQAIAIADIATNYLNLKFDSRDLQALPRKLRNLLVEFVV